MASSEEIRFPDTPRSELERTIEELVERAQEVLHTQGRLRSLLRANRVVVEQLEIEEVLRRIVEAAVDLVDARAGTLEVARADGGIERSIGATLDQGELEPDPGPGAVLRVPIRVRGEMFGDLSLTDPRSGRFTQEDEELVSVLAATAGVAIDNARLFDEVSVRERWTAALADVTGALLSDDGGALDVIVEHVADVVGADLAYVVVAEGADFVVVAAHGTLAAAVRGRRFAAEGSLPGEAMASGAPWLVDGQSVGAQFDGQVLVGPTFVVPLSSTDEARRPRRLAAGRGRPVLRVRPRPRIELRRPGERRPPPRSRQR